MLEWMLEWILKNKITTLVDWSWNKIIFIKKWDVYYLYLHLKSYQFSRNIGIIDYDKRTWTVKRDPKNHTFIKFDSYWFNTAIVNMLDEDFKIIVKEPWTKIYRFCYVKNLLENSKYLFFNSQWYERQIFLEKSKMDIDILQS